MAQTICTVGSNTLLLYNHHILSCSDEHGKVCWQYTVYSADYMRSSLEEKLFSAACGHIDKLWKWPLYKDEMKVNGLLKRVGDNLFWCNRYPDCGGCSYKYLCFVDDLTHLKELCFNKDFMVCLY